MRNGFRGSLHKLQFQPFPSKVSCSHLLTLDIRFYLSCLSSESAALLDNEALFLPLLPIAASFG